VRKQARIERQAVATKVPYGKRDSFTLITLDASQGLVVRRRKILLNSPNNRRSYLRLPIDHSIAEAAYQQESTQLQQHHLG